MSARDPHSGTRARAFAARLRREQLRQAGGLGAKPALTGPYPRLGKSERNDLAERVAARLVEQNPLNKSRGRLLGAGYGSQFLSRYRDSDRMPDETNMTPEELAELESIVAREREAAAEAERVAHKPVGLLYDGQETDDKRDHRAFAEAYADLDTRYGRA